MLPKYESTSDSLDKALSKLSDLIPKLTEEQKEEISQTK